MLHVHTASYLTKNSGHMARYQNLLAKKLTQWRMLAAFIVALLNH